jgi:hypothetical protein
VRNICLNRGKLAFTNFNLKGLKHFVRLKENDITIKDKDGDWVVNWELWEQIQQKFKKFDIYIDEISQIEMLNAREHRGKRNIAGTKFVAQIRKVLGDSKDSSLYLICQNVEQLDVAWRRLADTIVYCYKKVKKDKAGTEWVTIYLLTFKSTGLIHCMTLFDAFRKNGCNSWNRPKYRFKVNPYYKYYESKKFVRKEEGLL